VRPTGARIDQAQTAVYLAAIKCALLKGIKRDGDQLANRKEPLVMPLASSRPPQPFDPFRERPEMPFQRLIISNLRKCRSSGATSVFDPGGSNSTADLLGFFCCYTKLISQKFGLQLHHFAYVLGIH
jgi:hypothetical protein